MSFARDSLLIAVIALVGGFFFLIYSSLINPIALTIGASLGGNASQIMTDFSVTVPKAFDFIMAILYVGMPLIAFGLAFFNDIPSFFYWISMLLTLVLSVVGIVVQDIWEAITSGSLGLVATQYPITNFLLSNYSLYFVLVLFLLGLGTYVKTKTGGGGVGFA